MPAMARLLLPFTAILAALVLVISLDDRPPDADVVFVNRGDVFTLDPQRMTYLQDFRMAMTLYEGLVQWRNDTFEIVPAVAEDWTVSDDYRVYRFELRDDARWSNGDPVTAHDFRYAWTRGMLPDTAANYSNLFFHITGAREFFNWRTAQTRRFVADPWTGGDVDPETALAMVDRLTALRDADDRPAAIAWPQSLDATAFEDQIDAIRRAADEGNVADALAEATLLRSIHRDLDNRRSRAAEARWMWQRARQRIDDTVGIDVIDARTIEITLDQPTTYFLDLICFGTYRPVHRPTVEGWQVDEQTRSTIAGAGWHAVDPPAFADRRWVDLDPATGRLDQNHEWAKPPHLVTNGTHVVTHWRYKREMVAEANPHYHSPERIRSETIKARSFEDPNTAVLAFESGQVDWLSTVGVDYEADMLAQRRAYEQRHADAIAAMKNDGLHMDEILARLPEPQRGERRDIHVLNTFGTDFFHFNCREQLNDGRDNPFADPLVRRAFVQSVDREAITREVTRLNEPVATTIIPPDSIPGYDPPQGLPYNVDRARESLREAGWKRDGGRWVHEETGEPFPVVHLLYSTLGTRFRSISIVLKAMWEEKLGVQVELDGKDTKFYRDDLRQGNFMIARGGWFGDYGDPTTFLELFRTGDGNNHRGYSSEYVDDLLDQAAAETDPERRFEILHECERFLFQEDVPALTICNYVRVYMYDPTRMRGLTHHPRLTQYLWQLEVQP